MERSIIANTLRTLALTVLIAVAAVYSNAALATPGSGFIDRTVFARGTLEPHFHINLQKSASPGDVVIQRFILEPGGQSGWHQHPGVAIVTVRSGELTLDQGKDCSSKTYPAGRVAVEPQGDVHRVRNVGSMNLEFWVTFLDIPVGSPQRMEPERDLRWEDPGC